MVRTTKAEREQVADQWTGLISLFAPDIESDTTAANWRITQRTSVEDCGVHVRFGSSPRLGLNFECWRDWSPERRFVTYIHALSHYDEPSHKPTFWDRVATLHQRARDSATRVNDLFGKPLDWNRVGREAVREVDADIVDRRVEEPADRRAKLAAALGVAVPQSS